MKVNLWRLVFTVGLLLTPITCMNLLVVVNMANPMSIGFLTNFTVVNESQEALYVIPIGTIGREGQRRILPLSSSSRFALPTTGPFEIKLQPTEEHQFTYDWDDINFSELAIRNERGEWVQLVTDPTPTKNQYHQPLVNVFSIPPLSKLPIATESVIAATKVPPGRSSGWWTLSFAIGFIGPLLIYTARKHLKRIPPALPAAQN